MDINLRREKAIDEMRSPIVGGGILECRALDRDSACECVEWTRRGLGHGCFGWADQGVARA